MLRIAMALVVAGVLGGCATPPGQLKSEELVWLDYEVKAPLPTVYAGLQNNARHCGGLIDRYDPKWYPSQDMWSAKIDLYLKGGLGGTSDWVAGMIDLASAGEGDTTMRVGIQKPYSNPLFRANEWWKPKVEKIVREIESGTAPSCE